MDRCLSIYFGKVVYANSLSHDDIFSKGCLCLHCYDHVYLAVRGESKFIAHCPRKEEYRVPCSFRVQTRLSEKEVLKKANGEVHRTVEKFHRYFSQILESFLPSAKIYHHRKLCLDNIKGKADLGYIIDYWQEYHSDVSKYCLEMITFLKSDITSVTTKESSPLVKDLFKKANKYTNHTLSVMCVLKYLSQSRARPHVEALFLYANFLAYASHSKGKGVYFADLPKANIQSTFLYIACFIIFCPWMQLADRIEKGIDTSDLSTKSIPYLDISLESLETIFHSSTLLNV